MFPDGVKAIIMTEDDYERNVGQILLDEWELEDRIKSAIEYVENSTWFNKKDLLKKLKGESNENTK